MSSNIKFYDTIIVGAGPAGLFAAHRLINGNHRNKNIAILEKGKDVEDRRCLHQSLDVDITSGIGGAGLFSDCKLCLSYDIGHKLNELGNVDGLLTSFSYFNRLLSNLLNAKKNLDITGNEQKERALQLTTKCSKIGLDYRFYPVKHLGSDRSKVFIKKLVDYLKPKCYIYTNSNVVEFSKENGKFNVSVEKDGKCRVFQGNHLILAPGKNGAAWLTTKAKDMGLNILTNSVYIGLRVETLKNKSNLLTSVSDDPKVEINLNGIHMKTHCFCEGGYVIAIDYEGSKVIGGHSLSQRDSPNTSFNVLFRINSNDAEHHVSDYLSAINNLGKGRPVIQKLADFRERRATTYEDIKTNLVSPTLNYYSTGDLTLILHEDFTETFLLFLEKLNILHPDVDNDSTLLYAPVVEWCPKRFKVNENMQTDIENLYVCGDGSGWTQGIVASAMSGILAAEALSKE